MQNIDLNRTAAGPTALRFRSDANRRENRTRRVFTPGQWHAGTEPSLADVLDDPIVKALMHRDGVDTDAILALKWPTRACLACAGGQG